MAKRNLKQRPIAVDLFAGAGGMTLGFEQAGFDVLVSLEIDPIHCATHQYNFPFWTVLCRSITDIKGEDIRRLSAIGDRVIDVVFGGPPCQGFSLIGKRLLEDSRNDLIFHFCRLVLELRPRFFVMENVPGMVVGEHQKLLEKTIEQFQINNYKIKEDYQILNAAFYGVPQSRKRLFLLGCHKDLDLPQYPVPLTQPFTKKFLKNHPLNLPATPTVKDALQDLPEVENYPELADRDWVAASYTIPSQYANQLRNSHICEDDYSYPRQYDLNLLTSSFRTKHTPESIARFANTLPGKIEPISRFYKLSPEGLCNTLRAGTDSNRGAYTSPRPIHYTTPRCITVREAARLHSYPDWFRFHVTKWHGFRQLGNSVPPLLAKAIAREIMKSLELTPIKIKKTYYLKVEKLLMFKLSQAEKYYHQDRES